MTNNQRARLWDEINRYVATCGGDASKHVYGNTPRQVAVSQIEAIIREVEAAWANDMRKVAEARMADLDDQAERIGRAVLETFEQAKRAFFDDPESPPPYCANFQRMAENAAFDLDEVGWSYGLVAARILLAIADEMEVTP